MKHLKKILNSYCETFATSSWRRTHQLSRCFGAVWESNFSFKVVKFGRVNPKHNAIKLAYILRTHYFSFEFQSFLTVLLY